MSGKKEIHPLKLDLSLVARRLVKQQTEKQMRSLKFIAAMLIGLTEFVYADDYVEKVYSCGNDVGIYMRNAGWVVAREADMGERRVDRILSIALSLLATQNSAGHFNPGDPLGNWCGIVGAARPITVLQITTN